MTVFCLVEVDGGGVVDASLRALTLARGVAAQSGGGLAAVVFGEPAADDLAAYGVDDVYAVSGIDGYAPQAWGRALAALADGASAVVAAGTDRGNEVLAHVGAITGLPMAANCVAVSAGSGGSFEIVRQRWAGLLLEEAVLGRAGGAADRGNGRWRGGARRRAGFCGRASGRGLAGGR